jgi:peptidoglycan/LPS O-acetylase OafA/YrhL
MNGNVPALTGLRFFAAMYVVAFHFARPTNAILSCGYLGVGVFFVLSGFILTYVYGRTPDQPFDRVAFWRARFARVYPLYLLSFLLAAPAYISHRVMSDPSAASRFAKIGVSAAAYLGLAQAWIPGATHVWNSVAWTLSVETFFYAVFPFLVGPLARTAGKRLFIGLAAVWVAAIVPAALFLYAGPFDETLQTFVQEVPLLQLPAFLFGVLLGHRYLRNESGERCAWMIYAGAAGILLAAACSKFIPPVLLHDGLLLPFFGLLIYGLAKGGRAARWLAARPMVVLGEASYGMYLLQYPVWWAVLWVSRTYRLQDYVTEIHSSPALNDPKVFCAGLLLLIALSVFTLRYIETPARRRLRMWGGQFWPQPRFYAASIFTALEERSAQSRK